MLPARSTDGEMNMQSIRTILKLAVVAGLTATVWTGCSKTEEATPAPVPPAPNKTERPKDTTSIPASSPVVKPVTQKPSAGLPATAKADGEETTPTAPELEKTYLANPDFTERVQVIFQLSDLGSADALATLGRLFQKEQDPDLRVQVLNSLFDIEGHDDKKAALLAAGVATNQPKDVRDAAIDALGDIDAKRAVPILQSLLSDADEDLREHAKDIIEQLQTQDAQQK